MKQLSKELKNGIDILKEMDTTLCGWHCHIWM